MLHLKDRASNDSGILDASLRKVCLEEALVRMSWTGKCQGRTGEKTVTHAR